jgi:hypothetical protein
MHRLPSAHVVPLPPTHATPSLAHVGGGRLGAPPEGWHAPTLACGAVSAKFDPDTLAHAPADTITVCEGIPVQLTPPYASSRTDPHVTTGVLHVQAPHVAGPASGPVPPSRACVG